MFSLDDPDGLRLQEWKSSSVKSVPSKCTTEWRFLQEFESLFGLFYATQNLQISLKTIRRPCSCC